MNKHIRTLASTKPVRLLARLILISVIVVGLVLVAGAITGLITNASASEKSSSKTMLNIDNSIVFKERHPKMKALVAYRDNNFDEAYHWFGVAAKKHQDTFAMFYLGIMNYQGESVDSNITEAKRWYRMSCQGGFDMGCQALNYLNEANL